jgi:hypothetical protein
MTRAQRRIEVPCPELRDGAGRTGLSMVQTGHIDSLAEAEAYVAGGEHHIRQQRELVAELEREGRDATAARNLLAIFEDLRKQYIAERDRLMRASESERLGRPNA